MGGLCCSEDSASRETEADQSRPKLIGEELPAYRSLSQVMSKQKPEYLDYLEVFNVMRTDPKVLSEHIYTEIVEKLLYVVSYQYNPAQMKKAITGKEERIPTTPLEQEIKRLMIRTEKKPFTDYREEMAKLLIEPIEGVQVYKQVCFDLMYGTSLEKFVLEDGLVLSAYERAKVYAKNPDLIETRFDVGEDQLRALMVKYSKDGKVYGKVAECAVLTRKKEPLYVITDLLAEDGSILKKNRTLLLSGDFKSIGYAVLNINMPQSPTASSVPTPITSVSGQHGNIISKEIDQPYPVKVIVVHIAQFYSSCNQSEIDPNGSTVRLDMNI